MDASHISMRDLFDISSPALNSMVEAAQAAPGVFGARMTGGGFAGCAVALVDVAQLEEFTASTGSRYREETGLEPSIYPSAAAAGATIESLD
jgi:galactokinase